MGEKEKMGDRKSNYHGGEWVSYHEDLFTDCVTVAGVRLAEAKDGTDRYLSTWVDENGNNLMAVCGKYGVAGIIYRNLRSQE